MIKKNNQSVGEGLDIMVKTVDVLQQNFEGFLSARERISHIASLIGQQEEYIESITRSVSEIEDIVKSNIEISKDNSATAEQMVKQTEQLNSQIDIFTLKN